MTILGFDVSEDQPLSFPWAAAVAAGMRFVYIRASIGYRADANYFEHRKRARAAGLLTGSYHALLRHNPPNDSDTRPPMQFDPVQQARAFASVMMPGDELPPMVDVEAADVNDAELWAFIMALARPELVIYTSQSAWYRIVGRGATRYAGFRLWCAEYNNSLLPDIWPAATIKQTTGTGRVAWYNADLDLDEFQGNEAAFAVFTGKAAPVTVPIPNKLGFVHLQGGNRAGDWLKLAPTVAAAVGDLGVLAQARPGTLTLGRVVDDHMLDGQGFDVNRYITQGADPVERAAAYIALLRPSIDSNPLIQCWQGPNEQILESDDQAEAADPQVRAKYDANRQKFMEWYADFSYAFAAGLHALGKRASIGNWASGQPRPEHNLWRFWGRALQATVDFGAIECRHDYTGATVGGLLRVAYDNAEFEKLGFVGVPQVITELGVDVNGLSWRQVFGTMDATCDQLLFPWLDQAELLPYLVGACFYCDGGRPDWTNYDVTDTNIVVRLAGYVPPKDNSMPISAKTKQSMHDAASVILAGAKGLLAQVDAIVVDDAPAPHVWKAGDVALAVANPLWTYTAPNGAVHDKRPDVTYDLNVVSVSPDGLWLEVAPSPLWVKVSDVRLKA